MKSTTRKPRGNDGELKLIAPGKRGEKDDGMKSTTRKSRAGDENLKPIPPRIREVTTMECNQPTVNHGRNDEELK